MVWILQPESVDVHAVFRLTSTSEIMRQIEGSMSGTAAKQAKVLHCILHSMVTTRPLLLRLGTHQRTKPHTCEKAYPPQ